MTKIYFNNKDNKAVEIVDDYHWFKYYIKSFDFDIMNNTEVKKYFFCLKKRNEVYDIVKEFTNNYDLNKFIDIFIMLVNYQYGYECVDRTDIYSDLSFVIHNLCYRRNKYYTEIFKSLLFEIYGEDK